MLNDARSGTIPRPVRVSVPCPPCRPYKHALAAWVAIALALFATAWPAAPAHAEGLRDRLKSDVRQGLTKEKKRAAEQAREPDPPATQPPASDEAVTPGDAGAPVETPPAPEAQAGKPSPSGAERPATPAPEAGADGPPTVHAEEPKRITLLSVDTTDGEKKPEPRKGPKLPQRVIGKNLQLDLKLGAGYRGWYPQQYDRVAVDVANYYTWQVELKARFFKLVSLKRGFYESNGLAGPRTKGAAVAAQVGEHVPKAAWLFGVLGFPFLKIWEPTIRYEARSYETRARPSAPVCIIPRDADENLDLDGCAATTAPLVMTSGYETLSFGVTYHANKDPSPVLHTPKGKVPPLFFGIGLLKYTKPYQLTIGEQTSSDLLFDGRFRGAGVAAGAELGGGVDRFYADVDVQLGLGEVSLLEDLTLNELAPEDWLIGYFHGRAAFGYNWAFFKGSPTLILTPWATLGGAWFFFFETQVEDGEPVATPPVNWDLLWSVGVNFTLPL